MSGGNEKMIKHSGERYEIHPVFHDLLAGLKFDLIVGAITPSRSNVYVGVNSEKFRQYGDPTQRNLVIPHI